MAALVLSSCDRVELPIFDNRTPRERYEEGLVTAGLNNTALARDWTSAAQRALAEAPVITLPHTEEGFLDPASPAAFAYRFTAQRGQELTFTVDWRGDAPGLVFMEIFRVRADSTLERVATADSGSSSMLFEPRRSADHVVRIQPELLRGGRFRILLRLEPTLAFPVQGGTNPDIGSLFGAPRDGGRRSHKGIDIFARRGTPALAVGPATVTRVDEDRLGGLVVWLRDRRGNSIYYAHLDTQLVREGDIVDVGDTIGLVGRTGNARRTPAHLHFSVYRRGEGDLDPYWFVARVPSRMPSLAVDTAVLGKWARTRGRVVVRSAPTAQATPRDTLARNVTLQLMAASGSWYRVRLPDGPTGYLPASAIRDAGAVQVAGDSLRARAVL